MLEIVMILLLLLLLYTGSEFREETIWSFGTWQSGIRDPQSEYDSIQRISFGDSLVLSVDESASGSCEHELDRVKQTKRAFLKMLQQ